MSWDAEEENQEENNMITWTTDKRKISDLIPAEYNPRELTEKQAADLSKSLLRFNLADPIIINTNNRIIGGHQRINIMKRDGIEEVDVRVPSRELTEKEERELNIRLNKNLGQWDYDALSNFDEELLKDIGFDSKELDKIFQLENDLHADDVPDERPSTDIKAGDMFQLGEHRLLCGDSTKAEDVARLMGEEKADMVFTDPPYDFVFNRNQGGKGFGTSGKGDYGMNRFPELDEWMPLCINVLNEDCAFLCFEHWRNTVKVWTAMEKHGLCVKNLIIWSASNRFSMWSHGYFYNKYDIIVAGAKGDKLPIKKNQWEGMVTDFIESPVASTKESGQDVVYGTKPQAVLLPYIYSLTDRGSLILEPFGGSGSTLIACASASRRCFNIEQNPIHCQVIIDRWEKFTGLKAKKIDNAN